MSVASRKIGFIGVGNLGQAVLRAFIESQNVACEDIYITNRTERKLKKVAEEFGVTPLSTNEELIDTCDVVVLGVKPQDLYGAIEPIASSFQSEHIVLSLAAGIPLSSLGRLIPDCRNIIRVMPNTAAKIRKSVVAYSMMSGLTALIPWVEKLLSSLGYVVRVEDGDQMEALTVGASSGIGFIFELMIYWQEWLEERGIDAKTAKQVTLEVFRGASELALSSPGTSVEELQRKVVSLKGVTAAGLDSMRELEIERALRLSFEKAAMRDKELGRLDFY